MNIFEKLVFFTDKIDVGGKTPVLIAGPCVIENEELCLQVAEEMKSISIELGFNYIFKSSFDKANRTSRESFRSLGFEKSLSILEKVRETVKVPLITDVHESYQVKEVSSVIDVIQIPAFLCRQTDLLRASGESGKAVNIKKGQFMAPDDMKYAVKKVTDTGNFNVTLTERGTTFGYNNLVVDFRSIPIMRQYSPVIFDVTHSVQMPGGGEGKSSGKREFAPYLAKAAAAVGVDGFFIETHPEPEKALSDGPNMIPLGDMKEFLKDLI
ncbi:MAG: 3-deoxy-8-phosphooctulonate synthase [Bacteroidota bacterium]